MVIYTRGLSCALRIICSLWLNSPLDFEEINPEYSFNERTDAEAEAPIVWPPDEKSQLIGKDPDAGKD